MDEKFFLELAKKHLLLSRKSKRTILGTPKTTSANIKNSIISIIFSACAIEYAINKLIGIRIFFQFEKPYYKIFLSKIKRTRTIEDKKEFLKFTTDIESKMLSRIKEIYSIRNELLHGNFIFFEGYKKSVTKDSQLTNVFVREIIMPGLGSESLSLAPDIYNNAVKIVRILKGEESNRKWPIIKHPAGRVRRDAP